jgi:hypothetical protein
VPNARRESLIGFLIYGGLALMPCGLIVWLMLAFGGAVRFLKSQGTDPSGLALRGLGPLLIILGILMTLTGILWGLAAGRTRRPKGPLVADPGAQIVARFAMDHGELLTDEWQFEGAEDPRYYVKVRHVDGRVAEYETVPEVFAYCADGMQGEAVFQGGWLARFTPRVGGAQPMVDHFTDRPIQ